MQAKHLPLHLFISPPPVQHHLGALYVTFKLDLVFQVLQLLLDPSWRDGSSCFFTLCLLLISLSFCWWQTGTKTVERRIWNRKGDFFVYLYWCKHTIALLGATRSPPSPILKSASVKNDSYVLLRHLHVWRWRGAKLVLFYYSTESLSVTLSFLATSSFEAWCTTLNFPFTVREVSLHKMS